MWTQEAVWVGYQPQPWRYNIIFTLQVTQNPKNLRKVVWVELFEATAICPWIAYQCAQTLWICLMRIREAVVEVDVSLNHDKMTSFWLHKWPRTPKSNPSKLGITVWGYCHMPMDSISMCSNTLDMYNVDSGSSCWGCCQPQPWCNDIILTPQVTQNPKIWAKYCGYNCLRLLLFAHWSAYQCSQTLFICLMWIQEAVWDGCQLRPWCNDIILTPQVTQNPKLWAKFCGYYSLSLLLYAHGQHINVLKHFVYV